MANPPPYKRLLPGYVVGDVLQNERNYTGVFTGTPTESHILTSDDLLSETATFTFPGFTNLTDGQTVYWRERGVRDGVPSEWSNTLSARLGLPPKLVVDGDSITAWAGSAQDKFHLAHPDLPYANLAVGGSGIGQLVERMDAMVAAAPTVITIQIGTNDLTAAWLFPTADDWLNALKSLVATYKSRMPGVKVYVCTLIPAGDGTGGWALFPDRRAYVNPLITAGAGVWHDGVIPFASDPNFAEGAQLAGVYYRDDLHPSDLGQVSLGADYSAVMSPVFGY